MKWRKVFWGCKGRLLALSVLLCFSGSRVHADQLSTSFADVTIAGVSLGRPYKVPGPEGKGLRLHNLGDKPLHVAVDVLIPKAALLRPGMDVIPDTQWVQVHPAMMDIAPHSYQDCEVVVTVPTQSSFQKHSYQVMIWSHGVPQNEEGVTVSAGLLSRLMIKTAL